MRLEECSAPIDKNAYRVIRPARKEDVWMPKPKDVDHIARSSNILAVQPIPRSAAHMSEVLGKRRGRLLIVGYAKDQPKGKNAQAAWVVRCDCGNFEHRSRIIRWLGTDAPDMCRECANREYKTKGLFYPKEKARRETSQVQGMPLRVHQTLAFPEVVQRGMRGSPGGGGFDKEESPPAGRRAQADARKAQGDGDIPATGEEGSDSVQRIHQSKGRR